MGLRAGPGSSARSSAGSYSDGRDLDRLSSLLAEDPGLAVSRMVNWTDHLLGANPLNYVAMIGFDHERLGLPADLPGTGRVAAALMMPARPSTASRATPRRR